MYWRNEETCRKLLVKIDATFLPLISNPARDIDDLEDDPYHDGKTIRYISRHIEQLSQRQAASSKTDEPCLAVHPLRTPRRVQVVAAAYEY